MLFHAPRSRYIDPDRPPAAAGGLMSQYPDLVLGPRQPLDCRPLLRQKRLSGSALPQFCGKSKNGKHNERLMWQFDCDL